MPRFQLARECNPTPELKLTLSICRRTGGPEGLQRLQFGHWRRWPQHLRNSCTHGTSARSGETNLLSNSAVAVSDVSADPGATGDTLACSPCSTRMHAPPDLADRARSLARAGNESRPRRAVFSHRGSRFRVARPACPRSRRASAPRCPYRRGPQRLTAAGKSTARQGVGQRRAASKCASCRTVARTT